MAMKKILRYTISLTLLFSVVSARAQKQEWQGISIGADLSRFVVPFIDSTRFGWEFSVDYEILKDLFIVAEIGSQSTNLTTSTYNYSSAGGYTRLGADFNFMKHLDEKSTDKLLVGLRYGFTTFYHEANNILIIDDNWGNLSGGKVDRKWLAANWLEVCLGMRARLINNFYLGWSARMRIKIGVTKDQVMAPYAVPGYGQPWNSTWTGLNYSLYYKIPIYKKRSKEVEKALAE